MTKHYTRFTEKQLNQLKKIQSLRGSEFIVTACEQHDELVSNYENLIDSLKMIKEKNGLTILGAKLIAEQTLNDAGEK